MRLLPFRRASRGVRGVDDARHLPEQGRRSTTGPRARRVTSRHVGWGLLACALVTLMGGLSQSPRLLRRMDTFRVRQVEVRGTRYLAPDEVLAASGVGAQSSVFDPVEPWIAALREHPMIAGARIERRLPSTVRIVIAETRPVALAQSGTLVPVDRTGRVLPIAPEEARLDLPILSGAVTLGADGRVVEPSARAAVESLDRLQAEEPTLAAAVSEFSGADGLRLLLRFEEPTVALLPFDASTTRMTEVRRTLDDLAARGELPGVRVVDGRFSGQVVVSLNTAKPI